MPTPVFTVPEDDGQAESLTVAGFLEGEFRVTELTRSATTCRAIIERAPLRRRLSAQERRVLGKVVAGASQKVVAYELGVATTTVSAHLRVALGKLGMTRWEHAVLAAAVFERGGSVAAVLEPTALAEGASTFVVVRAELCKQSLASLTVAEREVLLLLVDGRTNSEVGTLRCASPRTVANQIAAASRKLGVHGRLELIRRLVCRASPSPLRVISSASVALSRGAPGVPAQWADGPARIGQ